MDVQIYVLEMRGERSGTFAVLPMESVAWGANSEAC